MAMNNRQKYWIQYKAKQKSISASNGCIEWIGTKNKGGYGIIEYTDEATSKRHGLPVHRALFMIHIGLELRKWQQVLHKCDNPSCININHLRLGTSKDNVSDMIKKGRNAKKYKYHHRKKKYDSILIDKAKSMLLSGDSMAFVAGNLGLSQSYVWAINYGKVKKDNNALYPLSIPRTFKASLIALKQNRLSPYLSL